MLPIYLVVKLKGLQKLQMSAHIQILYRLLFAERHSHTLFTDSILATSVKFRPSCSDNFEMFSAILYCLEAHDQGLLKSWPWISFWPRRHVDACFCGEPILACYFALTEGDDSDEERQPAAPVRSAEKGRLRFESDLRCGCNGRKMWGNWGLKFAYDSMTMRILKWELQ